MEFMHITLWVLVIVGAKWQITDAIAELKNMKKMRFELERYESFITEYSQFANDCDIERIKTKVKKLHEILD